MGKVIPAVRDVSKVEKVLVAPSDIVFLLTGTLLDLEDMVGYLKSGGKRVFVHADLVKGMKVDRYSLEYLKRKVGVDGIISTHIPALKQARKMGLSIVQRIFHRTFWR